jgi:hypothetical protein
VVTESERQRGERLRIGAQLHWQEESGQGRQIRRSRLIELDQALEVLEELNLSGERHVPESVRGRLRKLGIVITPKETPTAVLERVLIVQEVYLLHPEQMKVDPERKAGRPPELFRGE